MGEPGLIDHHVADEGDDPGAPRRDGFPLVLLHGWTGSKEDFLPIVDTLGRRRRVIAPDLPGHGETAPATDEHGYAFPAIVSWVLELLDGLGVGDFHLLGHSLGGLVAQRLAQAAAHRVLSLTLLATGPGAVGDEAREQVVRIATVAREQGMEQALEEVLQGSTDPRRDFVRQRFMGMTPEALVGGARNIVTAVPLGAFLRGVDFPVLVTHGVGDDVWQPHEQRLLARSITGARYEVIPDAQHSPAVENPQGLLDLLEPFLAEADRRAASSKGLGR